jgi:uncharacterized membrane protein YjjP (DUF1212 family)
MDDDRRYLDPEEILLLAADAARIVLESGGETYRAEETASFMAVALGGAEAECYATPTGVTLSFAGVDGRVHTILRRIKRRSMNLERVALVSSLSRSIVSGEIGFDEASAELCRIEAGRGASAAASSLAAAAGSGFFAMLFGGAWNDALVAGAVGALVSRFPPAMAARKIPDFFTNLVAAAGAAALCMASRAAGLASSADATIIGVLMLLVPGVAITNAIRDTIAGDLVAGVARGADAVMSAAALAAGAGMTYWLWGLVLTGTPGGSP